MNGWKLLQNHTDKRERVFDIAENANNNTIIVEWLWKKAEDNWW